MDADNPNVAGKVAPITGPPMVWARRRHITSPSGATVVLRAGDGGDREKSAIGLMRGSDIESLTANLTANLCDD